jgi:acetyltransferase-like isoleucine patch superfamily enzyme
VNTGAIVEHDASVGAFSHVAVRACLAGGSQLGAGCMLGAGATVIDGLSVCDDVTIGAGAVVTVTLSAAGTYVGVPARRLA